MLSKKLLEKLVDYLKSNGATRILLFGSHARGDAGPKSDLDIIVRFKKTVSLFDLVGLEQGASELIGKKVDLQTEGSLSPYMKDGILRESKVLL